MHREIVMRRTLFIAAMLITVNLLYIIAILTTFKNSLWAEFEMPLVEADGEVDILIDSRSLLDIIEELADRVWEAYGKHLKTKPYDPGFYAWGIQYEIRALLNLYLLTRKRIWLERALLRIDILVNYSDVNGDDIPSWGNYNETYGSPRYKYYEWSVWDGLISFSILRACSIILGDEELKNNSTLCTKANSYLNLVKKVINSWHKCWSWVSREPEVGYYWTVKRADVHGPVMNQFSALGLAELLLYEITGDPKYLSRPIAMARYLKRSLSLMQRLKAYTWTYSAHGNIEDISHEAIEVRFMTMCYERGIVFNKSDMLFLANTYKRLIWRGEFEYPKLNTYVGGGLAQDYSPNARGWTLLSRYSPLVWFYQTLNYHDIVKRKGISTACFLLGLTELLLYKQSSKNLAKDALNECEERLELLIL